MIRIGRINGGYPLARKKKLHKNTDRSDAYALARREIGPTDGFNARYWQFEGLGFTDWRIAAGASVDKLAKRRSMEHSEVTSRLNEEGDEAYRGRIAPTPTGYMHLGHAKTFLAAQKRALIKGGELILRVEDLDRDRCKPEYTNALIEDLRWAGLRWDEGPDCGGDRGPYRQSERRDAFIDTWRQLRHVGAIFPCLCSRKDVQAAVRAPHREDGELIYPGTCREAEDRFESEAEALRVNWRFRVPDGERISFRDGNQGPQTFVAGVDFGDFLVWRKDGMASYELAVVSDDIAMGITEVVRGEDLLVSTARQLLLYRSLGETPPAFYHCPLILDESGRRLAKRDKAKSLRALRASGDDPSVW